MGPMADTPWILLFPYLPLQRGLDVGRWTLTPVSEFDGPWHSAGFRRRSLSAIARHVDRAGVPLRRPSILVDQRRGADGVLPERHEVDALQLALGFAVLDAVPVWRSDAEIAVVARHRARGDHEREAELRRELTEERKEMSYASWRAATSDNAEPYFWPIRPTGGMAREYGSIITTTAGGSGRGLAGKVIPPNELHIPSPLLLDAERVAALYTVLATAPRDPKARKLAESVRWLLQAWRNTPSLLEVQRVVLLRTAFEVLVGLGNRQDDSTVRLARRLSEHFEQLPAEERGFVRPGDMQWLPSQPHNLPALDNIGKGEQKLGPFSDLERWFVTFSQARNKIVHEGDLTLTGDTTPGSVYAGPFWRVATRVLRDAVLVALHAWGFAGLWDDSLGRVVRRAVAGGAT